MYPSRVRWTLFVVVALLGCADPPPPPAPPPPLPPLAPILAPRPIATSAAVDLVASGDSVYLAWGVPANDGGGVRLMELGPRGAPRGTERSKRPPVVLETANAFLAAGSKLSAKSYV